MGPALIQENLDMTSDKTIRRRDFVKKAGAGLAALGAAPAVLGSADESKKLKFAVIGVGGRGSSHVNNILDFSKQYNLELAAVCDIYRPRLEAAVKKSGAKGYADHRKLLERGDIDCTVIATPDHWHAQMCIDSINAGCDVYCEKPWTRYAHEAKAVYHLVKKEKKILQIGTQHTADGRYWAAKEAIEKGLIGKLVWSQTSYSRNSVAGEWNYHIQQGASPENLDWEAFLGSSAKKPFNREHFFRFRKYWDYSGGIATDLHYHKLAPILLAVGADFPHRVTAGGGIWVHKDPGHQSPREVPDTFMTLIDMPKEQSIVLASSKANSSGLRDLIRGHEANLEFVGNAIEIKPERIYRQKFRGAHDGKESLKIPAGKREHHMLNFINAVRSRREEDLNCGTDLGYKVLVCIAMSIQAYRENKVLFWDREKEEIVDQDPTEA